MLVQLRDIQLSFPDKTVLDGVSLAVHRDDKMALVGENGAGKTCLLQIMLGRLVPDAGQVAIAAGTRIGYLEQTAIDADPRAKDRTCLDVAMEPFADLRALEQDIERIGVALARADEHEETARLLEVLGEAQHRFEEDEGYTYRARAAATLGGLGLPEGVRGAPVAASLRVRRCASRSRVSCSKSIETLATETLDLGGTTP